LKRTYAFLGNAGHVSMAEDDAKHSSTPKNREAVFRFFQQYLDNPGNPAVEDVPAFNQDEMQVTLEGNVYAGLKGDNLQTLAQKQLAGILSTKATITGFEDLQKRVR